MRPLVRELSDFSRDGSYDFSGSADLQHTTADGNAAPASSPKEDPNEPEAAKVKTILEYLVNMLLMRAAGRIGSLPCCFVLATCKH